MSKMGRKVKLRQNFASFFSAKLLFRCGHSEAGNADVHPEEPGEAGPSSRGKRSLASLGTTASLRIPPSLGMTEKEIETEDMQSFVAVNSEGLDRELPA
jgi:hypothetical protein